MKKILAWCSFLLRIWVKHLFSLSLKSLKKKVILDYILSEIFWSNDYMPRDFNPWLWIKINWGNFDQADSGWNFCIHTFKRSATIDSNTQPGYRMVILCYLMQRTKRKSLSLHIAYNLSEFHVLWKKCQWV